MVRGNKSSWGIPSLTHLVVFVESELGLAQLVPLSLLGHVLIFVGGHVGGYGSLRGEERGIRGVEMEGVLILDRGR
jgi:hypothetical protein